MDADVKIQITQHFQGLLGFAQGIAHYDRDDAALKAFLNKFGQPLDDLPFLWKNELRRAERAFHDQNIRLPHLQRFGRLVFARLEITGINELQSISLDQNLRRSQNMVRWQQFDAEIID